MPRAEDWALIDGGFVVLLGDPTIEVRTDDSTNDALSSFGRPSFVFVATARQTIFSICDALNLVEEVAVVAFAMDCNSGWHGAP